MYFYVEPEVSGEIGERTIMDGSVHPPVVTKLHYQFEGWLGDVLLETFPVFIITEEAKGAILELGASGVNFDEVEITVANQFGKLYSRQELPVFAWLKPVGEAGQDDIGAASDGRLVLSKRVLDVLSNLGMANALVEPFDHNRS